MKGAKKRRKHPKRERPDKQKLPPAENRLVPVVIPKPVIADGLQPLEPRQDCFVREYLRDLNGTQAALRAGYSRAGASQQAAVLLANPKVRSHIDFHVAHRQAALSVSADDIVRELYAIATVNVEDFEVREDGGITTREGAPSRATAAISGLDITQHVTKLPSGVEYREIKTRFRLWSKTEAAKQLREHLGLPGASPASLVDQRKITVHVHGPPVGPQKVLDAIVVQPPLTNGKKHAVSLRTTVGD